MENSQLLKIVSGIQNKYPFLNKGQNVIGYNTSTYSYEYDNYIKFAFIIMSGDDLSVQIIDVRSKTGLGAGVFYDSVNKIRIGTIDKPLKRRLNTYLAINKYTNSTFKRKEWITLHNNEHVDINEVFNGLLIKRSLRINKILNNIHDNS